MRCQRLNQDGKRCKREAKVFVTMHQNEYCYDSEPRWGVMAVCKHHSDGTLYKIDNETDMPLEDTPKSQKSTQTQRQTTQTNGGKSK